MKNKLLQKIKWAKSNFKLILILLFTFCLLLVSCAMSDGETTLAMALVAGVAGGRALKKSSFLKTKTKNAYDL